MASIKAISCGVETIIAPKRVGQVLVLENGSGKGSGGSRADAAARAGMQMHVAVKRLLNESVVVSDLPTGNSHLKK